jgi:hypothetical protein
MPHPDLDYKTQQQAEYLKKLEANPRVTVIRVAAPQNCTVGQMVQGVYAKGEAPALPVEGCSRPNGCICTYEPILEDIYP